MTPAGPPVAGVPGTLEPPAPVVALKPFPALPPDRPSDEPPVPVELPPAAPVLPALVSVPGLNAPFSLPLDALLSEDELEEQAICKGPANSANAPPANKLRKCAIGFTLAAVKARCVPPPILVKSRHPIGQRRRAWHTLAQAPRIEARPPILHRAGLLFEKCKVSEPRTVYFCRVALLNSRGPKEIAC